MAWAEAAELMDMQEEASGAVMKVLHAARPSWKERDLVVVQWKLAKVGVNTVKELVASLRADREQHLNSRLAAQGQKTFKEDTLQKLLDAARTMEHMDGPPQPVPPEKAALAACNKLAKEERPKTVDAAAFNALRPRDHLQDVFSPTKRRSSRITPQFFSMMDAEDGDEDEDEEVQARRKSGVYYMYAEDAPPQDDEKATGRSSLGRKSVGSRVSFGGVEAHPNDFAEWLESRKPIHRFDHASAGLAWEFPLAKSEKRELLLLQVAAGEEQAAEDAFLLRVKNEWAKKPKARRSSMSLKSAAFMNARRRRRSSHR